MSRRSVQLRFVTRRITGLAFVASLLLNASPSAFARSSESKESLVELSKTDARLKGHYAPRGFKVRIVAAEPAIVDPAAMAFDDLGNLFVAEWKPADRSFETWETLALPEGGSTRIRRSRKASTDVVKRLKDADGDGVFESSEVVVDGCEMPTCILPWKNSLLMTCVGRLERWSDEDADGKFETRTILADGFAAIDRRGLSGLTVGTDGWLYLASGDNDNHVVGSDGSRVDLNRAGGVFRSKFDGSKMSLFAMGLRNPYRGLAFDAIFQPFLLDGDHEDGSKFQGVRLINPVEEGDYGWRLRPGMASGPADFDRGAANGERPGKLPVVARLGRGSPGGLVIYNGIAFPEALRGLLIEPDPARRAVRGFKVETKGASPVFKAETTLMSADNDHFQPCQVVIGADGAPYVLDRRGNSADTSHSWGDRKGGRLYQITWQGDGVTPDLPTKPNNWQRAFQANVEQLLKLIPSNDFAEAERALRELVNRGSAAVGPCLGLAANDSSPLHARLLGIQGARQFWNDATETAMVGLLGDSVPEVRRLAAQALAWEPKSSSPRLLPKLVPLLDDPDGRVVREAALAISRHAEPRPHQTAAILLRWLYAHPRAEPSVKYGLLRALEGLGDVGVEEVSLAIRTRRGVERQTAVALFAALRSVSAAEQLESLVKIPDLSTGERVVLIRQFQDIPLGVPVPTQGLAEWVAKHSEIDPLVKVAALDACRIGGNPASALVLALLDDEDESVRLAATSIAARSLPPGALEKLTQRLNDRDTSSAERLAIVRALHSAGPKAFEALESIYLAAKDSDLRRATLRSMSGVDGTKAIPAIESAISGPDPVLRLEAVRVLADSPGSAPLLGKMVLNRALGRAELPLVLAALRKVEGADSRRQLASIEADATRGSGVLSPSEIRAKMAQGADPWAGLGIFFRNSSRCSTCHQVEGRGRVFGPALSLSASALSTDQLLDSILNPSKQVAPEYDSSRVILKDGRSYTGIVPSKDAKGLNLKEPDGREFRIAVELIDSVKTHQGTLMPATASLDLTPDELADLVAFLESKAAQDSLKHGPRRLDQVMAIGPFAPGADRLRIPLDRVDATKPLAGQDGAWLSWVSRESTGWGSLNLRGELGSKPGRVFLAVEVQSVREQAAALRFGAEGAIRVYLNGSKVADVGEHDPSTLTHAFDRPDPGCLAPLPDLAVLPLKAGSNLLIIALDHQGTGDARSGFEIASPEPIELKLPNK